MSKKTIYFLCTGDVSWKGHNILPLILLDEEVVYTGKYPPNKDLELWTGISVSEWSQKPKVRLSLFLKKQVSKMNLFTEEHFPNTKFIFHWERRCWQVHCPYFYQRRDKRYYWLVLSLLPAFKMFLAKPSLIQGTSHLFVFLLLEIIESWLTIGYSQLRNGTTGINFKLGQIGNLWTI